MEINSLANLIGQNELYSNGNATARKGERIDPATQQIVPPSAIYHGSKESSIALYQGEADITITERQHESEEVIEARRAARGLRLPGELAENSAPLKFAFDEAANALSPALMRKDWGFSVSNGELVILEGNDALSDSERTTIKDTLSEFGVDLFANHLASDFVDNLNDARRPHGESGILEYDLTEENFAEIIDLRAYLDTHAEGGRFAKRIEMLTHKHDLESAFFLSGLEAMFEQMSARAEPKYAVHS